LGTNLDLCCRRWHPAKTTGVLRIASSVLHILPQTTVAPYSGVLAALVIGRKAAQERFSEENFRIGCFTSPETYFSQKLYRKFAPQLCGTNGPLQAWMNSRNSITIASDWKHRQPIFLHPIYETGATRQSRAATTFTSQLAESVSNLYTLGFPFH